MSNEPVKDDRAEAVALTPVAFARWTWRQLTSMRTALLLLLLLAVAAIPGSLIPQQNVDGIKAANWQQAHPDLTPIYRRLGLFDVYSAPWFAAIYILLMISLIGCIIPRLFVYARAMRAKPPKTPRNLGRFPDSAAYVTDEAPDVVLARAAKRLRRYRLRRDASDSVSAEKGYLREAGNLLFHLSVIFVLVGFAVGQLFGYKGGVIVVVGSQYGFSNELTQYDDFDPGSLWSPSAMDKFTMHVDSFHADWYKSGPNAGMATGFQSNVTYDHDGATHSYDLKVNHPLSIGSTDIFLIGHGYAPVITVRDGKGHVVASGPTVFLPQNSSFVSFGVVKAPYAKPTSLGISGLFYPFEFTLKNGDPVNLSGDIGDGTAAMLSFQVYAGDLNLTTPQSVYTLDTSKAKMVTNSHGRAFNLRKGQTAKLPDGLGSVSFDGIARWNRLQISQQPARGLLLGGISLALVGLIGSLFIRPRRVWVRATLTPGGTLVEVAALDRTGGGDTAAYVSSLVEELQHV